MKSIRPKHKIIKKKQYKFIETHNLYLTLSVNFKKN